MFLSNIFFLYPYAIVFYECKYSCFMYLLPASYGHSCWLSIEQTRWLRTWIKSAFHKSFSSIVRGWSNKWREFTCVDSICLNFEMQVNMYSDKFKQLWTVTLKLILFHVIMTAMNVWGEMLVELSRIKLQRHTRLMHWSLLRSIKFKLQWIKCWGL